LNLNALLKQKNIDIIYNYTAAFAGTKTKQVVRTVYSNLYFPEIKFWTHLSFSGLMKKKIIDYYRLKGTLRADGLIFESEAMMHRAKELFNTLNKEWCM
jgi:hypothetical protein